MKKVKIVLLSLVIGLSMSVPAVAEIKVPDEIKELSPAEAFKKGFEAGVKSVNSSNAEDKSSEGSKEAKVFATEDYEITIKSFELMKGDKKIKLIYDFKNLSDETSSPWTSEIIDAFQDGSELKEDTKGIMDLIKKVQPGGTLKNVERVWELQSDSKVISFESSPSYNRNKTIKYELEFK